MLRVRYFEEMACAPKMIRLLVFAILLGTAACSNRAVYDNISIHQRKECLEEPPPVYEACMEQANKSYGEFRREREEALGQDSSTDVP